MPAMRVCSDRVSVWGAVAPPNAARVMVWSAALAVAPMIAVAQASAGEAARDPGPPQGGVTIALVDLEQVPSIEPKPAPEAAGPTWRTTFGSERQTRPQVKVGLEGTALAPLADVDVVLIRGVQASAPLRRIFSPRYWRLVVSRKVLPQPDPAGTDAVRPGLPRATAIAVKARKDLRITGRTFTLALHGSETRKESDETDAAMTAVRLINDHGRTLWIASIALPASCGIEDPLCPAIVKLDAWRKEKLKNDELTLIGGRIVTPARTDKKNADKKENAGACGADIIEADLSWERLAAPISENFPDPPTSCISIIRLGT